MPICQTGEMYQMDMNNFIYLPKQLWFQHAYFHHSNNKPIALLCKTPG